MPAYVAFLGVEAYGLIGLFASFQAVVAVLDLGLATTANREVARRSLDSGAGAEVRDLARTLEAVYGAIALGIALAGATLGPLLVAGLVTPHGLAPSTIRLAAALFALALALRWPTALYAGMLRGRDCQVRLNAIVAAGATLRFGGSLLLLALARAGLTTVLAWEAVAHAAEMLATRTVAWAALPDGKGRRSRVDLTRLRAVVRFAAGMTGITVSVVVLVQGGRLLVGALLPLASVGYYSLAVTASLSVGLLVEPIFVSVFPRLSALLAGGDEAGATRTFRRASRAAAAVACPAGAVLAVFAPDLLALWAGSAEAAREAGRALRLQAFGSTMNALMAVPYALQLAAGLTRIPLVTNLVAIAVLVPLTTALVVRFGVAGAAAGWALLNLGYYLVQPRVTHRYVLAGLARPWILRDTLPYLVAAFGLVAIVGLLAADWPLLGGRVPAMVVAALASYGVSFALCDVTREAAARVASRLRSRCGSLHR